MIIYSYFRCVTFIIILHFISCQSPNPTDDIRIISCGKGTCVKNQGICKYNITCVCDSKFISFPEDTNPQCGYIRKSQLLAFLLETFVSYGAGHLYLQNYKYAITKFIIWALGYGLFVTVSILIKKREENDSTLLLLSLSGCLTCIVMVIWQAIDVLLFGLNLYNDANNIGLNPW